MDGGGGELKLELKSKIDFNLDFKLVLYLPSHPPMLSFSGGWNSHHKGGRKESSLGDAGHRCQRHSSGPRLDFFPSDHDGAHPQERNIRRMAPHHHPRLTAKKAKKKGKNLDFGPTLAQNTVFSLFFSLSWQLVPQPSET